MGLKSITTHTTTTYLEVNGIAVQVYESVYEYASRNANFSDYADEKVKVSYFSDKDEESELPYVLVRPILLYKDLNFSVGKQILDSAEFPEILEINGSEYTLVNWGEHEISYPKADVMDKPVYTLIQNWAGYKWSVSISLSLGHRDL